MKVLWTNDIHLEFLDGRQYDESLRLLAEAECDCLLLGGDIGTAPTILGYLNDIQRTVRKPVYFVLGNHDFYHGSISVVRTAMQELPAPRWLGGMGFVPLTHKTCLVGHDGWGDGRYGNYAQSEVALNDFRLIRELRGLSKDAQLAKLMTLGDEAAAHFGRILPEALATAEHVVVLTGLPCDVAIGGIPCKAYTKSKHRAPDDPRGRLYEPFIDLVGRLTPLAVVIENVPDILTYRHADGSLAAHRIAALLRDLGYAVAVRILDAADFGVAQRRRRAFLFAWRQGTFPRPVPTHDRNGRNGLPKWRSIRDAIGNIEDAPENASWSHVFPRHGREVLDRIRSTPVGGKASVGYNEGAYRDAPGRPSRTLRGGAWIIHYRHHRVITVREAARIQGFSDGFLFEGTKTEQTLIAWS